VITAQAQVFQSPSHRGGGAARQKAVFDPRIYEICFNPLLIGEAAPPLAGTAIMSQTTMACFKSPSHRGGGAATIYNLPSRRHIVNMFQSPSHRGGGAAGSFSQKLDLVRPSVVSIPFSSGRRRRRFLMLNLRQSKCCFNPLLIGEAAPPEGLIVVKKVKSTSVSIPFSSGRRRRLCRKQVITILSLGVPKNPTYPRIRTYAHAEK